jgi:hypothetical protein
VPHSIPFEEELGADHALSIQDEGTRIGHALSFAFSPCCAVSGGFYPKIGSQSPNFPIFRSENGLTSM